MFREVCLLLFIKLVNKKRGKNTLCLPIFGFIFPSWLTHWSWDWTKSPAVFAVNRSAVRYCWLCVEKQNVCVLSVLFWLFGSSRKTLDYSKWRELIWPGSVFCRAGDLSKPKGFWETVNNWICLLVESSHTLLLRYDLYHISLWLSCETAECVGLQYLNSVWFSVA